MKLKLGVFIALVLSMWTAIQAQFLQVSDNQRYLVSSEGEPFFWLGDTGWEMLHRLDRKEMEHYMRNRSGKGFTVIQTVIVGEIDGLAFPNMEGFIPFEEFDPYRPNEGYFKLVDFAVRKAEEFGLVLALLPTWHRYVLPGSHPLHNDEAVFNPENAFAYEIRKQAYWSVFAGAFGHTYGNNNIWQVNRDDESSRIWPNRVWDEALESPGASQLVNLRRLMESRPFLSRVPDQELLLEENPSWASDHIRVTRDGHQGASDASYIMLYLPYYRSFRINTSVIRGDKLKVWWYNPQNGETYLQGIMENMGEFSFSNWEDLMKEGQGGPDWVVVIDDESALYKAPGQ